ncbi:MAG: hypothetical protein PHW63_00080 [Alphaproteobacteria bacterium]|nr:hypothetical protein [Alphaproteobacteria bacterium]
MAVRLTEDFLRKSISAFTEGERENDPVALQALIVFLKKAAQNSETFAKARKSLHSNTAILSFIEEIREDTFKQDSELRKKTIEQVRLQIAEEVRTEIEPSLRPEIEKRIRQEFEQSSKKELKQSTEEIIRLVKEMDSKLSSQSQTTHGKLETAEIRADRLGMQLSKAHDKLDSTTEQLKQASTEIAKLKTELVKAGQKGKRDFRVGTAIGIIGLVIGLISLKPMLSDLLNNNQTDDDKATSEKQQTQGYQNKEPDPKNDNYSAPTNNNEQRQGMRPKDPSAEGHEPLKVVTLFGKAKRAVAHGRHKAYKQNHRPHCKGSWKIRGQKQHRPS